jgi:hypothetical protein
MPISNERDALALIAQQCQEPGLVDEIESGLSNKRAFLFVRGEDGFVLKPVAQQGQIGVLVWAGWGKDGAAARHIPEVKKLAGMIGASWLRFHSCRKGWLKVAPKLGWVRQPDDGDGFMVFEIKLDEVING